LSFDPEPRRCDLRQEVKLAISNRPWQQSGGGPPHSTTLRARGADVRRASVLECAGPPALSRARTVHRQKKAVARSKTARIIVAELRQFADRSDFVFSLGHRFNISRTYFKNTERGRPRPQQRTYDRQFSKIPNDLATWKSLRPRTGALRFHFENTPWHFLPDLPCPIALLLC
jgi:hypothetical protein